MTTDNSTAPVQGLTDAARALLAAVDAELHDGWDCNSYHPSLRPAAEAMRAALAAAPHTATPAPNRGPLSTLTAAEVDFILHNPHGLMLLMDNEDVSYTQHSSMAEPDEIGAWPTPRWQAMYERGRSIIAEDLEIWPAEILKQFGFPATPVVQPVVPMKSLSAAVADALRPFMADGQKVIWREPFRWFDDDGVMPNHYDGMSLDSLAAEFGYEVIHDCGCAGVIKRAAQPVEPAAPASDADSMQGSQPTKDAA